METDQNVQDLRTRNAPIEIAPEEFRRLGYQLVDRIADFLSSLPQRPVTPGESAAVVRQALGSENKLPDHGTDPQSLLEQAANLVFDHSLFNSHPRFWGYVTSPAAPIGILGDLLASTANPNVGSWVLAPMATEIEAQSVRWIAELIGYPSQLRGAARERRKHGQLCWVSCRPGKSSGLGHPQGGTPALRMRRVCASTHRAKRTPGFRRRLICSDLEPTRSVGCRSIIGSGWTRKSYGVVSRRIGRKV